MDELAAAERKPRADALRNRQAILLAAERMFADHGYDVPMARIALAAGIGRSTLLRNFPSRLDLAFAIFAQSIAGLREHAATQRGEPGDFEALLDRKLDIYIRNGGLAEAVQKESGDKDYAAERAEVAAMLLKAARPAQAAGLLRPGLTLEDLILLQQAMGGAMLSGGTLADRRDRAARIKALLLEGLRVRG